MQRPLRAVSFLAALLTAAACTTYEQRLERGALESAAMAREMDYAVYTPPGFGDDERLPLVVFLHGGGDDETCFDRAAIGALLDERIGQGQLPRAVVVVPDGELGFWENWHDGSHRYRDWVVRDLLPAVRARYHTRTDREGTHLLGISMGGHGALRLARLEPEVFASVAAISAPVMDAEHLVQFTQGFWVRLFVPVDRIWGPTDDLEVVRRDDLFERWQRQEDLRGMRLLLAHGTEDRAGIVTGNERFHQHLAERGVGHDYLVYGGRHLWVDWRPMLPEVFRFLLTES